MKGNKKQNKIRLRKQAIKKYEQMTNIKILQQENEIKR